MLCWGWDAACSRSTRQPFAELFADWPHWYWALYTEWRFFPFAADSSLSYFLKNVSSLKPVTLLMIGVGAIIAFWVGSDAGFPGLRGSTGLYATELRSQSRGSRSESRAES